MSPALAFAFTSALALCAAPLAACGDGAVGCTLIGCTDLLLVTLEAPASSLPYSVVLTLDGERVVFSCDAQGRVVQEGGSTLVQSCSAAGFSVARAPRTAAVVVTSGGPTWTGTVTPTYTTARPNGPGCDPVCSQASVTIPRG